MTERCVSTANAVCAQAPDPHSFMQTHPLVGALLIIAFILGWVALMAIPAMAVRDGD